MAKKSRRRSRRGTRSGKNLEPRTVKGHYQYGPAFSLRYAYQIERTDGTWIITVPIRFHWPDSRMTDMVDIPMELADSLKLSAAGGVCAPGNTVLEDKPRNREIVRGRILDSPSSPATIADKDRMFYDSSSACRVRRNLVVLDRSVLNHLRDYWRREIKGIWNRANFEINPVFLDCEERPQGTRDSCDQASDAELSAWTKDETIWDVHFNLDPNHRPAFKRFVGKWNNMHTGVDGEVIAHELGHYLGLDDEYDLLPENLPLTSQELDDAINFLDLDCRQFNPDAGSTYIMCAHWAGRDGAQGVYPWLITRRYVIAEEFQCREDGDCAGAEYCDRGWATVGRNQCLPRRGQGDNCERNEQCVARAECKGLPLAGRCVIPASVALNGACIHDTQCTTGACSNDRRVCQCREDDHCGTGNYCAVGFLGVGQNSCRALQADNESCPVADGGRTCAGGRCAWGRCYTPGAVRMGGTCYVDAACAIGKCSSIDGTRGHLRLRRRPELRNGLLVRPGRRSDEKQLQGEAGQGRGVREGGRHRGRASVQVGHLHGRPQQAGATHLQVGSGRSCRRRPVPRNRRAPATTKLNHYRLTPVGWAMCCSRY